MVHGAILDERRGQSDSMGDSWGSTITHICVFARISVYFLTFYILQCLLLHWRERVCSSED